MKLTKMYIDKIVYEGKNLKGENGSAWSRDVRWDSVLPGFGIRVFPSSKKVFVVSYRAQNRKRLMTIGRFGVLTIDQARERCRDILSEISKDKDPLSERQQLRNSDTFGDLWEDFLENYAKRRKRSWAEDERRFKRCIPESWLNRKLLQVSAKDVEDLHSKIGQRSKIEANRTLALISKMFNYAKKENPAKGIEKWDEVKRDRWMTMDEVTMLRNAIANEPNIFVKAAIWLYLATGVRKSELLTAKWADVDFTQRVLNLKQTKSGKPHRVLLSSMAMALLERLPRMQGNPYILPGGKNGHHLVNLYKPWNRIKAEAKVIDIRPHDLRRTMASWMVQSGESLQQVGRLLNHSSTRVTEEHYAHLSDTQSREAIESHGEKLQKLVGNIEI